MNTCSGPELDVQQPCSNPSKSSERLRKASTVKLPLFAGILQAPETSSKASCRLRMAEVTSSSLVGFTLFLSRFAGKTLRFTEGWVSLSGSSTPVVHQRKVTSQL